MNESFNSTFSNEHVLFIETQTTRKSKLRLYDQVSTNFLTIKRYTIKKVGIANQGIYFHRGQRTSEYFPKRVQL